MSVFESENCKNDSINHLNQTKIPKKMPFSEMESILSNRRKKTPT
jgi:hypothetical protein